MKTGAIFLLLFFSSIPFAYAKDPASSKSKAIASWETSQEHAWHLQKAPSSAPKPKDVWEISPETYWFFYEEPDINVKMEGWMYGFRAAMTQRSKTHPFMGQLEGRYATGNVDYDGSLSDGTPHTDHGTDHAFELRGNAGYDWLSQNGRVTFFTGLGYRFWFNHLDSQNAYERNVSYLYSPIGLEGVYSLNDRWQVGASVEYDLFWQGWVKSNLSDVNPNFNDLENTQDNGQGARGALTITRTVNRDLSIAIEPFVRYWNIENSDTAAVTFAGTLVGGGYEPANTTWESGLKIGFLF